MAVIVEAPLEVATDNSEELAVVLEKDEGTDGTSKDDRPDAILCGRPSACGGLGRKGEGSFIRFAAEGAGDGLERGATTEGILPVES